MFYYKTMEDEHGLWLYEDGYRREYSAKTESVFAQCNGHFGVRAAYELDGITQMRGMFVSGLYQKADKDEVTELVNCPDICGAEISINNERLSLDTAEISGFVRKLNVGTGELVTSAVYRLKSGSTVKLYSRRFASKDERHLFCHEMRLELLAGEDAVLSVTYGINGQITNSGASHFRKTECRVYENKYMTYQGMLADDGLEVMTAGTVTGGEKLAKETFVLKRRSIYQKQQIKLKQQEPVSLLRVSFIRELSDISNQQLPDKLSLIGLSLEAGYDSLLARHQNKMDGFWQMAQIQISGATQEEQAVLMFAQYHLQGMVPDYTDLYSAGAKGLTGEGYKGHVFWDTEIFLLPFFYYEFPETAKNLLKYRYYGIDGARAKAAEYGYQGTMFPWEAAKDGYEETPLYAALNIHTGKANKVWSGIKEHHVTADIVYAVMKYASITNDWDFIEKYGAEIVFGSADFWTSRAVERNGRLEILDIIGPDEYNEHIDNNTYTNYMARFTVVSAIYLMEQMKVQNGSYYAKMETADVRKRIADWTYFAEHIYLAKPAEDHILPQDDTFLRKKELPDIEKYRKAQVKQSVLLDYSRDEVVDMQVLKQADFVMLLNLFPGLFVPEVVKENVLFYEARTLHDSSLSYCAHAQACARIGEGEMAWNFFEKAMEVDLDDNPLDSTDGIHSASLGGIWNCVVLGFAGVDHDWDKLSINPHLPKHWQRMEFQFCFQGNIIHAAITGDTISLRAKQPFGEPIELCVFEEKHEFVQELVLKYGSQKG